ncbi:MAG: type II secretion system GspH family protein [Shewanella sp.]|nr:type II secretion system GspH family protein [Shewanella sp.]MCF1429499.1 type II secretion system GspH family protein [Shewanella sp.]MCF1438318.1 type II secretion system GspH family protein [Shewanella sp.]MCF1457683.1 type II secretion system GspH family protein [Shewanella sp.]
MVTDLRLRIRQTGFTLVEMVVVIIILGVMAVGVTSFVILGTRIFLDSTSVDQVLSQSRFALERMTRDIRNAVPNSLRINSDGSNWQCLEFVPIKAVSSYLSMPVYPDAPDNTGEAIVASVAVNNSMMALIYPLVTADVYANPEASSGKLFALSSVSTPVDNITTYTFKRNVQFSESSPRQQLFLVSDPISYCFVAAGSSVNLYYYSGYGINHPTQLSPSSMGIGVLMAQGITNDLASDPPIDIEPATLVNHAIVILTPEFEAVGHKFKYQQQVQVVNVP